MREMLRRTQELQNNFAYQHALREMKWQQNDPKYQYLMKEMERREKDPSYRALLMSMEDQRRHDYPEILRTLPNLSRMQDLLSETRSRNTALQIHELRDFASRFDSMGLEVLVNADALRSHETVLRTIEEITRAHDIYGRLSSETLLSRESIRFAPHLRPPTTERVKPEETEQTSAELFLLDLQAKCEELRGELVDNEQLVIYAIFNGVTMEVNVVQSDTYNRIRLIGVIGGLETVVVIKESDFILLFRKVRIELEEPRRRIGFIIEGETETVDGEA